MTGPRHIDLRAEQRNPPETPRRKHLIRRDRVVERDPALVDAIVIHQTACVFGASEESVKRALGDRQLAIARRALGVGCHALAFRGFWASPNPLRWYVWHGNGYNERSLGLEIEGLYAGLEDDPETVPREDLITSWGDKPPMKLSDETLEAAKAALLWLIEEGQREGMFRRGPPVLLAHRQSNETRRSDPGEAIWKRLVMEYGVGKLGCVVQPEDAIDGGRPIPVQWSARGVGRY